MIHCQTTKLEDHPMSDVCDCLCNISVNNLRRNHAVMLKDSLNMEKLIFIL
jgi:hypothetical protein